MDIFYFKKSCKTTLDTIKIFKSLIYDVIRFKITWQTGSIERKQLEAQTKSMCYTFLVKKYYQGVFSL